jgi:ABC-2 type transport system permease protein
MKAFVIARRELASYFLSPISYVVATLFLVATGYEFWLLTALLNGRDAPHGAVMQYFFGGTFLYWLFLMFIVSVIAMRLVAEERRLNTLEPLLTAPVSEAHVVVGKYLGALAFYACLWAPTFLYVLVLRSFAPDGIDFGPVAAGYLGTLLVGAGALALGLAASTVTRNQILAAVLSFVTLALLLLVGALGDALMRTGSWGAVLAYVNLFRHMEDFGRGIVDSRRMVYHLGLVAIGLYAAARLLGHASRRRVAVELVLLVAIVGAVNWLGARHYLRGDWTRGRTFALSEKTQAVLRGLDRPVDVIVFMLPTGAEASDLTDDVHELLDRARALTKNLRVDWIDVDRDRERALTVGKRYNVSGDDVENGVIIVDAGDGRSKFITKDELAEYDFATVEEGRPPRMKAWKGEQALISTLLTVVEGKAPEICFVKGHGEPALDSFEPGEYGDFAEELRRDHYAPRAIELGAGVPPSCALTVVAGPVQPLPKADVAQLQALLERGGRLLVLDGPHFDPQVEHFSNSGLEDLLERWGISLRNDLVVDEPRLRGSAVAFAVTEGYADHPITRRLMHHQTLWSDAREVRAVAKPGVEVRELVHTSDDGWGETDLAVFHAQAELAFDPKRDVKGPVSIAAAAEGNNGARVVALGSAEIAGNRAILGYNRDLLLSTVAWLLKAEPKIAIGPRTPEHLRLQLDDRQLTRVLLVSMVGLPLLILLIGAGVFWVRRS